MKLSQLFTAYMLAWGCASIPVQALTVGKLRGAALLGQALHVTIPVQLAAQEEAGGLCADADVYYGDNLVDRSRVAVQIGAGQGGPELRVQASSPVDEPVVTLYVRIGCRQQSTRKYVMLADFASDVQTPVPADVANAPRTQPSPVAVAPSLPSSVAVGQSSSTLPTQSASKKGLAGKRLTASSGPAHGASAQPARETQPTLAGPVPESSPRPPRPPQAPRPASNPRGPRLQLLPLDLTEAWEPQLKFSDAVLSVPLEDDPRRSDAAALWRALNATPEELLKDAARIGGLEKEMLALRAQTVQNQQSMVELGARLQRAHEERYSNPVIYVMAVLLAGVAAVGTYWWRRRESAFQPWWVAQPASAHAPLDEQARPRPLREPPMPTPQPSVEPVPDSMVDLPSAHSEPPTPIGDSGFFLPSMPAVPRADAASSGHSDFAHSVTGSLRAINTQEMVDVRQQADFFLALGQHDDAIRVLQNGIGQSGDSNPLVFLDLVAVLHNLGRKDEYEQVRTTFNELYTGYVPPFTDYSTLGDGLMAYALVCERIARLWPTESAMEYIEHCLVRDITDTPDRGFELSAFRDLLMLHGIIGKIVVPNQQPSQYAVIDRTLPFIAPQPSPA
ncbi:MAG: type IV pilus assembly protein FimV [Rhodoferax sp.]